MRCPGWLGHRRRTDIPLEVASQSAFVGFTPARGVHSPNGRPRRALAGHDRGLPARSAPVPGPVFGHAQAVHSGGPPHDVEAYRRELVEAGYTMLTIGTKLTAPRRLFAAAVEAGLLPANPAERMVAPNDRREPGRPRSAP